MSGEVAANSMVMGGYKGMVPLLGGRTVTYDANGNRAVIPVAAGTANTGNGNNNYGKNRRKYKEEGKTRLLKAEKNVKEKGKKS